jgi:D-glycero-D-manno-heptose 1,7-bisphosphate phosphatase
MPIFELEKISEILISQFSDIAIKICPHDDSDNCDCRKPKDGLIIQAALEFGLDPAKSWMVGDRASDIEAGISAGCKVAFINSGQDALEKISHFPKTEIFRDLLDFAHYLTFTSR